MHSTQQLVQGEDGCIPGRAWTVGSYLPHTFAVEASRARLALALTLPVSDVVYSSWRAGKLCGVTCASRTVVTGRTV